jgi:hypothetical protein
VTQAAAEGTAATAAAIVKITPLVIVVRLMAVRVRGRSAEDGAFVGARSRFWGAGDGGCTIERGCRGHFWLKRRPDLYVCVWVKKDLRKKMNKQKQTV